MTDNELRQIVRESIARHLGTASTGSGRATISSEPRAAAVFRVHASHTLLPLARGGDGDGVCLIEPTVRCNHCGYCLSYGH